MADGFIVGSSVDTATPPSAYWGGGSFVPEIDAAQFFATLSEARLESGRLQSTYVTQHVEAYGASLNITHNPALGTGGI